MFAESSKEGMKAPNYFADEEIAVGFKALLILVMIYLLSSREWLVIQPRRLLVRPLQQGVGCT